MKILVCGNGPSLLGQLKDKDLSEFDKVVRVNNWEPIEGYNNRCDAWVFYPRHHIGELESVYDFKPYLSIKEHWLAHAWALNEAIRVTGKTPEYYLSQEQFDALMIEAKTYVPTTGVMGLYMATLISENVWIAGFDFYESENTYYYKEGNFGEGAPVHDPSKDKVWVTKLVNEGKLNIL